MSLGLRSASVKLPRKISSAVKELGLVNALVYATHRVLSRVGGAIHRYYFLAQPLTTEPILPGARGRSIIVRVVGIDDPALRNMPLVRKVLEYRAAQNAICLG